MQEMFAMLTPWLIYFNALLTPLYNKCTEFLALDGIFLPAFLKTPLHFFGGAALSLVAFTWYMPGALVYLMGVGYPLLFTLSNYQKNFDWSRMAKYWVVYHISDFFLQIFPFTPLQLGVTIYLVRNNFSGTDSLFNLVMTYYNFTVSHPFVKGHLDRFKGIKKEADKVIDSASTEKIA